jgi:MFS family permease
MNETTGTEKAIAFSDLIPYAVILFLVEFVRGAYLVSYLPSYAVDELGFAVSVVGIAVSVHYFADNVIKSFVGYLLDRFSVRLIVSTGMFISLAGLWIMQYVHSAWLLVTAAAILGIGGSPIWLVCLSTVQEDKRAEQMGFLYTVWLAGLGLGPVLINFLLDRSDKLSFWILFGMWFVACLMSLQLSSRRRGSYKPVSLKKQFHMLMRRLKFMYPLIPGMILQTMAAGMLVPILSGFATENLGLTHSQYSYVLVAGGASTLIFLVPMGKMSDRRGRKWFLVAGFGAFSVLLYALTFVSSFSFAMLAAVLLGFSYASVLPAWNALLAHFVPRDQQGMGWGIFSSVEGIGVILGPLIGGWIAAQYTASLTILISAMLLAAIALFYLFFKSARIK